MDDTPCGNILDQLVDYVNSGLEWGIKQFKSACPPNMKRPKRRCMKSKLEMAEKDADIGPPCTEKKSYIAPSQICPKIVSCCYIKMQDPYAFPCCKSEKPKLSPCPLKCQPRQLRKPSCFCDFCRKEHVSNHKCCRDRPTM